MIELPVHTLMLRYCEEKDETNEQKQKIKNVPSEMFSQRDGNYSVLKMIKNGDAMWNNWNQWTKWLDQEQPFNPNGTC